MQAQREQYARDEEAFDTQVHGVPSHTRQSNSNPFTSGQQRGGTSDAITRPRMAATSSSLVYHQPFYDPALTEDEYDGFGDEGVNIFQQNNPPYQMPRGRAIMNPSLRASKPTSNNFIRDNVDFAPNDGFEGTSHQGHETSVPTCADSNSTPKILLSRAHEMKARLGTSPNIPLGGGRKRLPEHDPENYEIKRLRVDEQWHWGDIAKELNRQRIAEGKAPTFTEAAVYSRFVRNGPRIAQVVGDTEFDPKDHLYIDKKKRRSSSPALPAKFTNNQDEALVESFAEVRAMFWEQVAEVMEQKTGKKFTLQDCAQRWRQI